MTETMGPCGCEAPLSILAAASELRPLTGSETGYSSLRSAHEYRARCRAAAAAKSTKRSLQPGQRVKLAAPLSFGGMMLDEFIVERQRIKRRRSKASTLSTVFRSTADSGLLCTLAARHLAGATIT